MIAIVTFDAIEAQSRSEPSFYGRLVHIMSTAGFAKLRRQIGRMHRNASSQGHSPLTSQLVLSPRSTSPAVSALRAALAEET